MKKFAKQGAQSVATLFVMIPYALYRSQCLVSSQDRAFSSWSQAFALIPGITGEFLRAAFYRLTIEQWGENCQIQFGTILSRPQVRLHPGVSIGPYCSLGMVEIGEDTILGTGIHIPSGTEQHGIARLDIPIKEQPRKYTRIVIGKDCWLGNGCIILANVGNHCVIGAGSVVTKPIDDLAIAVGNPARVVRYRNQCDDGAMT